MATKRDFQNGSENPYDYVRSLLNHRNNVKICHNTTAHVNDDGSVSVVLHFTDIARCYPDGRTILNTGGYHTVTTKDRLNRVLPLSVRLSQKDYVWTLHDRRADVTIPYTDGMTLEFSDIGSVRHPVQFGTRDACSSCGQDVEYWGPEHGGWIDRGANGTCDVSGGAHTVGDVA